MAEHAAVGSAEPTVSTGLAAGPFRVLVKVKNEVLREQVNTTVRWEGWESLAVAPGTVGAGRATQPSRRRHPDAVFVDAVIADTHATDPHGAPLPQHRATGTPPLLLVTSGEPSDDPVARATTADDYLATPFSAEQLAARIRLMLRHRGRPIAQDAWAFADLSLTESSQEVFRGADCIALTAREFELLRFFLRQPRQVWPKMQIMARVWPFGATDRTTDVERDISRLRSKIDKGRPRLIHSRRGQGYLLRVPDQS